MFTESFSTIDCCQYCRGLAIVVVAAIVVVVVVVVVAVNVSASFVILCVRQLNRHVNVFTVTAWDALGRSVVSAAVLRGSRPRESLTCSVRLECSGHRDPE